MIPGERPPASRWLLFVVAAVLALALLVREMQSRSHPPRQPVRIDTNVAR
ncbi:MAG TPA: hypothetical protein VGS12_15075 [Caulobacteraceae bacterium]|nr:hypothetical protein [Caulobacteraceae bacterium]